MYRGKPFSNLTNYHSHSSFCDGKAPAEDFIKEAIRQGFYSYGVSGHAPLPYHTHWSMDMEDTQAYIDEILFLKEKYKNEIEIYLGMEIDYLTRDHNPSSSFFRNLPLDYVIGSVHLLEDADDKNKDIDVKPEQFCALVDNSFGSDIRSVVEMYFTKLKTMIDAGGFDFIGHCDKISLNASAYNPAILSESWYRDLVSGFFHYISDAGCMIEINSKAYARAGMFFPNIENFTLIKQLSIPVVVNSDAHYPADVNAGRFEVLAALLDNGIKEVMELRRGEWISTPIKSM